MDVQGNGFLQEMAGAATAVPLLISTAPTVHLAAAAFAPGASLDPSTLTEATFDGYAAKPLTGYGTPHLGPNGNWLVDATPILAWVPTGSVITNSIFGWWVMDHAGNLVSSGLFAAPIPMVGITSTLSMVWGFGVAPGQYQSTLLP